MLQLIYESIFVDKDIFTIISLIIVICLIVAVIIGVSAPKRKAKKGIADFKINFENLKILNQVVMQTDNKFYIVNGNGAQDKLFKTKYEVGQKVENETGEIFVISRIVRQPKYNALNIAFAYTIYFSQFEYSEFPKEIKIDKNKNVDFIKLDKNNIKLIKGENIVYERPLDNCKFKNLNFEINFTDDGIKSLFSFSEKNFAHKDEFHFFEEILIKYARNVINNRLN